MNILVSVFHFPPMSGGGSVLSSEIVNSFSLQGHQIFVVIPDIGWKDSKFEPIIDSKIKIIRVKTPSKNNIKLAARLCKKNLEKEIENLCEKEKFDFIFTVFHPFHRVSHAAITAAKKLDIPVIVKIDDPIFAKTSGLKSLQRNIEKIANGKALRSAYKILVVNESVMTLVMKEYNIDAKKIAIIPNGIDTKFFKKKINHKNLTVIFSGVMYYHRGIDVLLDSLSKVIEKFPGVKTILLGEGPEMDELKKITNEKDNDEADILMKLADNVRQFLIKQKFETLDNAPNVLKSSLDPSYDQETFNTRRTFLSIIKFEVKWFQNV